MKKFKIENMIPSEIRKPYAESSINMDISFIRDGNAEYYNTVQHPASGQVYVLMTEEEYNELREQK